MDLLGQALWLLMFVIPIVIMPLLWRRKKLPKIHRIIYGVVIAVLCSVILYFISLSIIFRDGMGPG